MADEIDIANELVDNELSWALKRIRHQAEANKKIITKICLECGDPLPLERQELGFGVCVSCKEENERRGELYN